MPISVVHQAFIDRALPLLQADPRLMGVAVEGSWLRDEVDEWSDLDLVILADTAHDEAVLADRPAIAARLGDLLTWFTAEHVGEPRIIICLYGPPLLHVDLKFVTAEQLATNRMEDPAILWERDGALTAALAKGPAHWPPPDWQWLEDRFWTWVHYQACKLGRGELLEAISGLDFLRTRVLGATAASAAGHHPQGVRRFEQRCPGLLARMLATVPGYDAGECAAALHAAIAFYRHLRDTVAPANLIRREAAEREATAFLAATAARVAGSAPAGPL
jgi:predicted nucleotidyltransferase